MARHAKKTAIAAVAAVLAGAALPLLYVPEHDPPEPAVLAPIGDVEGSIYELVDQARANAGLDPLSYNEGMAVIARAHSQKMARQDGHQSAWGKSMHTTIYYCKQPVGNGMVIMVPEIPHHPADQAAVEGWVDPDYWGPSVLASHYTEIGVGAARYGGGMFITPLLC